ncbi:hypothetical protein CCACVL1_01031, partial [Corchorus capsularis]
QRQQLRSEAAPPAYPTPLPTPLTCAT